MPISGLGAYFRHRLRLRQIVQFGLLRHAQDFADLRAVHVFAVECIGVGAIQRDQHTLQADIVRLSLARKFAQGVAALNLDGAGSNIGWRSSYSEFFAGGGRCLIRCHGGSGRLLVLGFKSGCGKHTRLNGPDFLGLG